MKFKTSSPGIVIGAFRYILLLTLSRYFKVVGCFWQSKNTISFIYTIPNCTAEQQYIILLWSTILWDFSFHWQLSILVKNSTFVTEFNSSLKISLGGGGDSNPACPSPCYGPGLNDWLSYWLIELCDIQELTRDADAHDIRKGDIRASDGTCNTSLTELFFFFFLIKSYIKACTSICPSKMTNYINVYNSVKNGPLRLWLMTRMIRTIAMSVGDYAIGSDTSLPEECRRFCSWK